MNTNKTTSIRQTVKYELYQGFGPTANLYSVIKRKGDLTGHIGFTDTWLNEMQKEELVKMSDQEFDNFCSKINFQ